MNPPPPMIASEGIGHGEREADGDGGVDGVASALQHRYADVGCQPLLRGDHRVFRPHRRLGADSREREENKASYSTSHIA